MKIVTSDQMRVLEQRAEAAGVAADILMENAGLEVARSARRHLGRIVGVDVVVLVGKGNNGGDGLVAARRLSSWGGRVTVCMVGERSADDPKLGRVLQQRTPIIWAGRDRWASRLREALSSADAVIDAALGTGRSRLIGGLLGDALAEVCREKARRPRLRVLGVDLPSGVDADTGAVDPACAGADVTVTLGRPKAGLYRFPGAEVAGKVEIADIGLPPGIDDDLEVDLMTPEWAASMLPARPMSGHKGTFGRVMVVAGSRGYVGAAALAASAAGRAGAGLVTLAVPESLRDGIAPGRLEATYLPLEESSPGVHATRASRQVLDELGGYDALLVGCGLGPAMDTQVMLFELLLVGERLPPTVIDADGLNFLSYQDEWSSRMTAPAIFTPHPGEMARLTGLSAAAIEQDRMASALDAARRWGRVVVLKGAFTVVAFPDGGAAVSPFANPALASAGTGDVLAGVIAGLLAQGLDMKDAAALGVYVHGAAAELARGGLGEAGVLAGDLLPLLPRAIESLAAA